MISETGKGKLQINWSLFREMSEALKSLRSRNDGDTKSLFLRKKVEVEEHINHLTAALVELTDQRPNSGEDEEFLSSVSSMIEELNALSALFAESDSNSDCLHLIGEMLECVEARQPNFDTLFSLLTAEVDPNANISEEMVDNKISDNSGGTEDRKTDDSPVAATNQDGKGKNKKSKKSKRKDRLEEDPNGNNISEDIVDNKISGNSGVTEDKKTDGSAAAATNQDGKGKNKKQKKSKGKGRRRK